MSSWCKVRTEISVRYLAQKASSSLILFASVALEGLLNKAARVSFVPDVVLSALGVSARLTPRSNDLCKDDGLVGGGGSDGRALDGAGTCARLCVGGASPPV